jgi:hypothetical protein
VPLKWRCHTPAGGILAWDDKSKFDSHSGRTDLVDDGLSFRPFLYVIGLPPVVHLVDDSVNQLLFLSRLGKGGLTLVIEAGQDLFEFIDSIVLDRMAQILRGIIK